MTARSASFKQADVTRAAKGAIKAGLPVARMEIDREGKIIIVFGEGSTDEREYNPWDEA